MDDLLDRFHERRDTGVKNDRRHDHRADIFHAAVAQRMFLVRLPSRELRACDGDNGRKDVAQVIHRVQSHRDRSRDHTHGSLECCQKQVRRDPDH